MKRHIQLWAGMVKASTSQRTITGTVCTYSTQASASTGPVVFEPGSLKMGEDLSRVKLLIDHDQRQPVGYATEATDSAERLSMTFHVPEGDAGDRALHEASHGLRDGFSVGAWVEDDGYYFDADDYMHVTASHLREVTLCALPAIDDARVSDVAATHHSGRTPMKCSICGHEHAANAPCQAAPAAPVAATTEQPNPAEEPKPADPPPAPQAPPVVQQAAPILPSGGAPITLAQAAEHVSKVMREGGSASQVRAALADVVPAGDAGQGFLRPQWLGELWKARRTARPYIDSITRRGLPVGGTKVYGFQFDQTPTVGAYAGNKAEVPTSNISTKPLEADVKRMAGGWDIDRIYIDRGESSIIEAIWAFAVEDYLRKTEAAAVTEALAAATVAPGADSLPAALLQLGQTAGNQGSNIDFVLFAPDVYMGLGSLTRDQVPWWMGSGDTINLGTATGQIGNTTVAVDAALSPGEVFAGDERAATWFEDEPPVRVNAIDLAHGGVDLGLFGYYAHLINDAGSLFKTTVTPPAEPAALTITEPVVPVGE